MNKSTVIIFIYNLKSTIILKIYKKIKKYCIETLTVLYNGDIIIS